LLYPCPVKAGLLNWCVMGDAITQLPDKTMPVIIAITKSFFGKTHINISLSVFNLIFSQIKSNLKDTF